MDLILCGFVFGTCLQSRRYLRPPFFSPRGKLKPGQVGPILITCWVSKLSIYWRGDKNTLYMTRHISSNSCNSHHTLGGGYCRPHFTHRKDEIQGSCVINQGRAAKRVLEPGSECRQSVVLPHCFVHVSDLLPPQVTAQEHGDRSLADGWGMIKSTLGWVKWSTD